MHSATNYNSQQLRTEKMDMGTIRTESFGALLIILAPYLQPVTPRTHMRSTRTDVVFFFF